MSRGRRHGDCQLQVKTYCLDCGGGADDEFCVGPFLTVLVPEFDPDEFRSNPFDDGTAMWTDVSDLPQICDEEGNLLPDHPVLAALRPSKKEAGRDD